MNELNSIPLCESVGSFRCQIMAADWVKTQKDGQDRVALVLTCLTSRSELHPEGERIEFWMHFTNTLATGGKNAGKPSWQMSVETLHSLGMSREFGPEKVGELLNRECEIVMKEDEYNGKKSIRPRFINPIRNVIPASEAKSILASIMGAPATAKPAVNPSKSATVAPPTATEQDDDLPFDK